MRTQDLDDVVRGFLLLRDDVGETDTDDSRRTAPASTGPRASTRATTAGSGRAATTSAPTGCSPSPSSRDDDLDTRATRPMRTSSTSIGRSPAGVLRGSGWLGAASSRRRSSSSTAPRPTAATWARRTATSATAPRTTPSTSTRPTSAAGLRRDRRLRRGDGDRAALRRGGPRQAGLSTDDDGRRFERLPDRQVHGRSCSTGTSPTSSACRSAPATSTRRSSSCSSYGADRQVLPNIDARLRAGRRLPGRLPRGAGAPECGSRLTPPRRPPAAGTPHGGTSRLRAGQPAALLAQHRCSCCPGCVVGRSAACPSRREPPGAPTPLPGWWRSWASDGGEVDQLAANALADLEDYWDEQLPRRLRHRVRTPERRLLQRRPRRRRPGGVYPQGAGCGTEPRGRRGQRLLLPGRGRRELATRSAGTAPSSPSSADGSGPFLPALVMAHEFGHAIQARVGYRGRRS